MNIVDVLTIPTPPSSNLGFYENTYPECILASPDAARQADIPLGNYSNLSWVSKAAPEELEDAITWGSKTLPGAGGFYYKNPEDNNPIMGHLDRVTT